MTSELDALVDAAQRDLEAALRGASLCSVSRDPSAGATTVKFLEGRWYTLRDIQRRGIDGIDEVEEAVSRRVPNGPAWRDYADGARSAIDAVRRLG